MAGNRPRIDPLEGPKQALAGRVVTMNAAFDVIDDGVVYVDKGAIIAVQARAMPAPAGFDAVAIVETDGTISPGLIELHNHISYNALPLWQVPKKYTNRDQWSGIAEYRKRVSGPMRVIGEMPELLPALVRYVECKCLLGGVTTSQGIALASNAGVRRFYRGIVRNVEQTDDADLPEASTRIADVEANDAALFLARLKRSNCFLLHLSEGTDASALKHFLALQVGNGDWAITKQLAGIHCAALRAEDFAVMAEHEGAMIWSPLSNLLLYGDTARVAAAKAAGVRIGIGSDWSPSGSKNLLGELKAARAFSAMNADVFSDRELITLATMSAARILGWDSVLGSLEAGKRADLIVLDSRAADPYAALIDASERDMTLAMINGVARYGRTALMQSLSPGGEALRVGGESRRVFLKQATQDPAVQALSLADATETMRDTLQNIVELATRLERPQPRRVALTAEPEPVVWTLALDELHDTGVDLRPRLPFAGARATGPSRALAAAAAPLSQILEPIALDPLTVVDDADFLDVLRGERNLMPEFSDALFALYQ